MGQKSSHGAEPTSRQSVGTHRRGATPSFAGAVQGAIQSDCFESLDAPVLLMGAEDVPPIPLNSTLEQAMLPNADKVASKLRELLEY